MSDAEFDALKERLRTLKDADRAAQAPARVESALVEAFGKQHAARHVVPVRTARVWQVWTAAGAAAATLAILAVRAVLVGPAAPPAQAPQTPPEVARVEPEPRTPAIVETPALRPVKKPKSELREITTEFIPLVYGFNPAAAAHAPRVRVKLPRTALAKFGLPVNPERLQEPVEADLVIGADGMARAIRFVRTVRLEVQEH